MTSTPPLIHYGLAPFKISTAPFKMLMRIFRVPDLLFIIRVGFINRGKGLLEFYWDNVKEAGNYCLGFRV